jgi:hypothetical protein
VPSPFYLDAPSHYARWRERKLARLCRGLDGLWVEIRDPRRMSATERGAVVRRCRDANMALFATPTGVADKEAIGAVAQQLGLTRVDDHLCAEGDGLTSLTVTDCGRRGEYIPYSDKPINWHTDGYYNSRDRAILGMLLYCVRDAAEGGANALLDPEWVYLRIRDTDPDLLAALMAPDAMTIPANVEDGVELRPARSGPVFWVDPPTGNLCMRYTARKRSIEWRGDARTRAAVALLEDLLSADSSPIYRYRLAPGEGLICNNVLHNRTGFRDDVPRGKKRLVYRGRYLDRVAGTDLVDFLAE